MKKIEFLLSKFEEIIMVAGGLLMVFMNFANVVCRYLLPTTPFSYTEELVVLLFVWVSMFGISYAYKRRAHTLLTILSDNIPGKFQIIIVVISMCASMLLMFLIAKTGYGMVMNQLKYNQILPGMKIPVAVMGWVVPLGAAAALLSAAVSGCEEIRTLMAGEREEI